MNFSAENRKAGQLFNPHNESFNGAGDIDNSIFSHGSSELETLFLLTIHEPTTIALTIMYILSFMVGFVGNVMAIRVLTGRRSKPLSGVSATRSLLINLAVCDLMVVLICMPITLGHKIYTAWVYGDFLCRAVPFTQAASVSASVLSLTVISVNRYYSVHSPLNARSFFTQRKIVWTIVVVWVLSSAICSPLIFMNKRDEIPLIGDIVLPICQEIWPQARHKQVYNVLLFVTLYCIPVTFNLVISFLTGKKLWKASHNFDNFDPQSQVVHSSRLKMRKKIAKMVVALVLLFAVSWLPLYMTDIWIDHVQRPPHWVLQLRPFAQWLGLTNSSLNPICYCFIGDLYRSAKVIKTKYHQRLISLLSSSSSSSSIPRMFSFRRQKSSQRPGGVNQSSEDTFSEWCSHTSVYENPSQMVSLQSLSERTGSRSTSDLTDL
ncbi:galanin receptor type 1 [Clupea harengus]|uniref:Galanin receptor type 1 n=1 Tax=Clupea harengus TaxID=7950 RepID=A0A6P3VHB2_CLUHA|nr:galanin receptor type 1 [Clupea harengus]